MDRAVQVGQGVRKEFRLDGARAWHQDHIDVRLVWMAARFVWMRWNIHLGFEVHPAAGIEFLPRRFHSRSLDGGAQLSVEQDAAAGDLDLRSVALRRVHGSSLAAEFASFVPAL